MESLNGDNSQSKRLCIAHSDGAVLHTSPGDELSIIIRVASSFVNHPNNPAPFHVPKFYSSSKMFLGELKAVLEDHRTCCASKCDDVLPRLCLISS